MPQALQATSAGAVELACDRVHPVSCSEVLHASSLAGLVAIAMEHGASAHGFTPAWYTQDRQHAMAAAVTQHLE